MLISVSAKWQSVSLQNTAGLKCVSVHPTSHPQVDSQRQQNPLLREDHRLTTLRHLLRQVAALR